MLEALIKSAGYTRESPVLHELELSIRSGEVVLVHGSSGSGKTTLVFALTGVLKHLLDGYVEGSIRIGNIDPLSIEGFSELPGLIALLLQDPERQLVFPAPIDELYYTHLALGYSGIEAERNTRRVLEEIGLSGYEKKHVEELSTGMRRRLALATLEIGDPDLLLLDEPSANMDPDGIRMIRELVERSRSKGRGVLILEHKLHYFKDLVDKTLSLQSGRLVESIISGEQESMDIECRESIHAGSELAIRLEGDIGYRNEAVLVDVEFEARRGEIIVIAGPNGSGKTTLLRTIAGMLRPLDGVVEVKASRIFYAPQNPDQVFVYTTVEKEMKSVSRKTGIPLEELVEKYPWYYNVRERSPYHLSHGQRRLLEIVIALAYGQDIVLLDEPSTGLDPTLYTHMVKEIKRYAIRGGVVIIATHDPRLVLEATRAYVIERGRIREIDKCELFYSMIERTGLVDS